MQEKCPPNKCAGFDSDRIYWILLGHIQPMGGAKGAARLGSGARKLGAGRLERAAHRRARRTAPLAAFRPRPAQHG